MILKKHRQNAAAMIDQEMWPAPEMVKDYVNKHGLDQWKQNEEAAYRLQQCGSSMAAMVEHIEANYEQKKTRNTRRSKV